MEIKTLHLYEYSFFLLKGRQTETSSLFADLFYKHLQQLELGLDLDIVTSQELHPGLPCG